MNDTQILKELIHRNIIKDGTRIHATVKANGIGGGYIEVPKNVIVTKINDSSVQGWERDNAGKDHTYTIRLSNIHDIEGMSMKRMAQAYKIKLK
tara:strand:+ start:511 stop:792 length:282 start_codon:yes stop_codon:yes gene_type:complete